METVLIAGATGYLGRALVAHYRALGWTVRALVRDKELARSSGLAASEFFQAEATRPVTLCGAMAGVDLVVSTLGITRQRDGLTYWDVDYQANANLLSEALAANVPHFAYVHVLNADKMRDVPLVAAKQAFVDRLRAAPIGSTIIQPSGFFSDMGDFLNMAQSGRVWLFGTGAQKLNPIDGADLAQVIASAVAAKEQTVPVGGPDIMTQREMAELAFATLGKPAKITFLPDILRRLALHILPYVTPRHIHGPAKFFLSALALDMVGPRHGETHLAAHFADQDAREQQIKRRGSSQDVAQI